MPRKKLAPLTAGAAVAPEPIAASNGAMPPPPPASAEATGLEPWEDAQPWPDPVDVDGPGAIAAEDDPYAEARDAGYLTRKHGAPLEANPFASDTEPDEWIAWRDGWTRREGEEVTVDESGVVTDVQRVASPSDRKEDSGSRTAAAPNGESGPRRVQLTLSPGRKWTPEKCQLCETKCSPHPAVIEISRAFGSMVLVICPKCDTALTVLAGLVGAGEITLRVKGPGESGDGDGGLRQLDMLDRLEAAAQPEREGAGDDGGDDLRDHSPAFREGAEAFWTGASVEDNPHLEGSFEREDWDHGFLETATREDARAEARGVPA